MSWEVYIEWRRQTCLVGRLHVAERGQSVSFEYAPDWLKRPGAFAVDPTSLPLQAGAQHSPSLFGAIADCGPDRWGRVLIERAVRKKVLAQSRGRRGGMKKPECRMQNTSEAPELERNLTKARIT